MFMLPMMMMKPAEAGGDLASFLVTVPSGTVSADLTDFPVPIDLAEMPPDFWTNVRSDGGNIRAYLSDGTTLIPHDITYVNKDRSIGRMVAKHDLLAASDNEIVIKLLDVSETALAVTDTNGRNAVWSDYEVVWVFPEDANRTGNAYTQSMSLLLAHSEWIRTDYDQLTGNPHNGISTDGTHFISTDDIALRRMNMSYVVQQTVADINTALSAMTGLSNFDHMGDPVCVGTSTFFTATTDDATYRRFLIEYRTSDLTLLNAWEMTGDQRIFGATVCYDGTNLLLFAFTDETKFIKYTTSGSYVGEVSITGAPGTLYGIQGSTVLPSGNILLSAGAKEIFELTPAGAYVQTLYEDPHAAVMEGLEYRDGNLWLLKGNGALITLRNDVHQDYRKLHGGDAAYADLPTFSTFTIATSFYWTTTNFQQGFVSAYNIASSAGARVAYDEGPDRLDTFATTDSWIVPPVNDNPAAYSTRRVALKHNGTTERKLIINGAVADTDATITANPGGSGDARFLLNASRIGFEGGEAYYQFAYLHPGYLSDAWLEAEYEAMHNPSGFFTVTTLGEVDYEAEVEALLDGTEGWAVDLADTSTVFTDTGGTTPVTTPGDGIGRLNSKFGTTAYNWTQATNKPLWNGASQQTDGTNDLVQTTNWSCLNGASAMTFTIRFLVDDLSVNRSLFSCSTAGTTTPRFGIRLEADGSILVYGRRLDADSQNNFTTATGLISTGVEYTLQVVIDYAGTGDVEIFLDGVSVLTGTLAGTPAAVSATNSARCRWSLNTSNTLNDWFDGKTGSAVMALAVLDATGLANCRGYVERNIL